MKYTEYRGYPYPRDAKETGNGALHSELLARAVAADFDVLDAGWAAELQHATLIMTKSGDVGGFSSGSESTITGFTTEKVTTGIGLAQNPILQPLPGGTGWYHVVATLRSKASGAITAGAQHRMQFNLYTTNAAGVLARTGTRYSETFQSGTNDLYNQLEGVFYLGSKDQLRLAFFHTNAASTATVVGSGTNGTRLAATKIAGP